MCGVLGIFRPHGTAEQYARDDRRLGEALRYITPRGPDGLRRDRVGPMAVVTSRLAMIGGTGGAQPMTSADGGVVLAFNGEVYGHRGLRPELAREGYPFVTADSDTETLCALLSVRGPSALADIDGQYAIAAYYVRQGRLVLVRDRFGIHPLFFARHDGAVYFGSSARAVARLSGRTAIDPEAVYLTMALWGLPDPRTVYRGVSSVRPGHLVEIDERGETVRVVDPLSFPQAGEEEPLVDDDLVIAFDRAVRDRTRADAHLGLLLSGGVDSGAVAQSLAIAGQRLPAYVLASEDSPHREVPQALEIGQRCGHAVTVITLTRHMFAERLAATAAACEMPLWRTGPVGFDVLAATARSDGVRGLVTGDGADELFCGYDIFGVTVARQQIGAGTATSRAEGMSLLASIGSTARLVRDSAPPASLQPYVAGDVLYSHLPRWRLYAGSALRLFAPELRDSLRSLQPWNVMRDLLGTQLAPLSPLNRARLIELTTLFQGFLISAQSDRPFMMHGVEGRYPFLARRVADLAIRADPRSFLTHAENKVPIRRALAGRIGPGLASTPKRPYDAGRLSPHYPVAELCGEFLSPAALAGAGLFDIARVSDLLLRLRQGPSIREVDSAMLLAVLTAQVLAYA